MNLHGRSQDPSLAIVPTSTNVSQVTIADTANKLGLHDAMRYGTRSLASDVAPKHSLELRLNNVRPHSFGCKLGSREQWILTDDGGS